MSNFSKLNRLAAIALMAATALSAGIVEPVGALPQADEELLCLVMPLRLPDNAPTAETAKAGARG